MDWLGRWESGWDGGPPFGVPSSPLAPFGFPSPPFHRPSPPTSLVILSMIILHSFHAFALSGRSGRSDLHGQRRSEGQNEGLSRLARVFGICEQRLIEQFHRHEPYAAEHYARSKGTIASWREAISRLGKGRKGNTADELTIVLIRYGAWVASTCDVERNFSKTSALRGGQCNDEFLDREENVIVLQTAPHLKEQLVPAAIRVWVRHFGRPCQLASMLEFHERRWLGISARACARCLQDRFHYYSSLL